MSNELVKVEQLPLSEIMNIGKAFAESGMFPDIRSAAQAIVKIQAGQEMGIPPFASMSGIHIISGKPTIGANLIAGRVKNSGKYDYKVLKLDDQSCILEFFEEGKSLGKSEFTKSDAQKADTKNMGKYPKNMLFARAMSNGQKWFCPDVYYTPVYTPGEVEETEEKTEDTAPSSVETANNGETSQAAIVTAPADEREELTVAHPKWADVVDAITNKGYKIASVDKKYKMSDDVRRMLAAIIPVTSAPSPNPVTQDQIHNANASYTPPVQEPAVNGTPVTTPGPKKRPF